MTISKKYNDNLVAGGAIRDGNGKRIDTTYANVDLSNLSTTGNAKIKDIFVAEYGVTTYQEVLDAYNAGKLILCTYNDTIGVSDTNNYILTLSDTAEGFVFRSSLCSMWNDSSLLVAKQTRFLGTSLREDTGWGIVTTYIVEQTSNKVTSLLSSSTDIQYPSAKCVYDVIQTKQNKISIIYGV